MKNITKFLITSICGLAIILPSQVSAFQGNTGNGCYAESVIAFEQGPNIGGGAVAANRSHPETALGEPDRSNAAGGFVSLGKDGWITLQFAGAVYDLPGDDIMVWETSYSGDACGQSDDETAEIYLSQDGSTWVSYGEVCRDAAIDINGLGLDYVTQIKIVSTASTNDGYDVDGVEAINGCQNIPQDPDPVCENYEMFYSHIQNANSSEIYKVSFDMGEAVLTSLTSISGNRHISYDTQNDLLYAVDENATSIDAYDASTGDFVASTPLQSGLNSVVCNVYKDGKIYLASTNLDIIVEVNIATGTYVTIAEAPVTGGDLVFKNDELYLATREGNRILLIDTVNDTYSDFIVGLAPNVNGLALNALGQFIVSTNSNNMFTVYDDDGLILDSYPVTVNGNVLNLRSGDLAAGCNLQDAQDPNDCVTEFVNGGFEDDNTFSGAWSYVPEVDVPGWSTTSATHTIEIQKSGLVDGNASNSGDYHFELNGDAKNNIYQEVCSTPGSNIAITFAHRKRQAAGVDKMELYIGGVLADIESNTALPFIANTDMEWHSNTFVYTVPSGQTSTFIYFKAVSGTSATVGNLLDDIAVSVTNDPATDVDEFLAALSTKEQEMISSEIAMFPVPANNRLNVKLTRTLAANNVSYEIVSILGQTYNRGIFEVKSGQTEISEDISRLADGTYFFVLNVDGNTTTKQFVKASR